MKRFFVLLVAVVMILGGIISNGFCVNASAKDEYIENINSCLIAMRNMGTSYEYTAYMATLNIIKTSQQYEYYRGEKEQFTLDILNLSVKNYQVHKDSLNMEQNKMAKAMIAAAKGWLDLLIADRLGFNSNYQEISRQKRSALGIYKVSEEMYSQQDKKEIAKFLKDVFK